MRNVHGFLKGLLYLLSVLLLLLGSALPVSAIVSSGYVTDSAGAPISGAKIESVENSSLSTTSDADGYYSLSGLPSGTTFNLMFSKEGYLPIYALDVNTTADINLSPAASAVLFTSAEMSLVGQTSGKGFVAAKILDENNPPSNPPSGLLNCAKVTATSANHPGTPYLVSYFDGVSNWRYTCTYPNGVALVLNADVGDTVTLQMVSSNSAFAASVPIHGDAQGGAILYGKVTPIIGVFVNGTWYLDLNGNGAWDGMPTDALGNFGGLSGAIPVGGDWTGTGYSKMGVFVNGTWYLDLNGNWAWNGTPTDAMYSFGGLPDAIPVTGDWTGTGATKIGVFVNGSWYLDKNGDGVWNGTPTDALYNFGGLPGAIPVTGDWTGTGTTKIGVFVNGKWYLDLNGNGRWDGTPTDAMYSFGGLPDAIPVTGDWTGTGATKIGVFVNGTWYLDKNGDGLWNGTPTDALYSFGGLPEAIPVTGKW